MEKFIIDECTGWEYELKGDYYYPTGRVRKNGIIVPEEMPTDDQAEEKKQPIGIWGERHLQYIKQYKKTLYLELYISGKLNAYLANVNAQATDLLLRLENDMAEQEGVTEQIKAEDPMRWVGLMNNIRNRAMKIVNSELIFA